MIVSKFSWRVGGRKKDRAAVELRNGNNCWSSVRMTPSLQPQQDRPAKLIGTKNINLIKERFTLIGT